MSRSSAPSSSRVLGKQAGNSPMCKTYRDPYVEDVNPVFYPAEAIGQAVDLTIPATAVVPPAWLHPSGAISSNNRGKIDYKAIRSPLVERYYGEYLRREAHLPDGTFRPFDNWKKGIPQPVLEEKVARHAEQFNYETDWGSVPRAVEHALALRFNITAWLHNHYAEQYNAVDLELSAFPEEIGEGEDVHVARASGA